MDLQLKGKRAIVNGATRGIGRVVAETLADEGCNVAICARSADPVAETVEALKAKGVSALGQAVDITDGDASKTIPRTFLRTPWPATPRDAWPLPGTLPMQSYFWQARARALPAALI